MDKLIISFITGLIVYIMLSKNTEHLKSDATKPEKCFYDFELLALHKIFVDSLKQDPDILKKMKGKLLPSVCILDLVANKKKGFDKFLESNAKKYDTDQKNALTKYFQENYDNAFKFAIDNGLEFLTRPNIIEIESVDAEGNKTVTKEEINVMQNFKDIIEKKFKQL